MPSTTSTLDAGQRAVARLPPREHLRDLPPLAEHVDQDAHQARPREVERVLILRRQPEADGDRREDQRRAEPADETENSIHHFPTSGAYPRHRSLSTDLAVRNRPNVMKLR